MQDGIKTVITIHSVQISPQYNLKSSQLETDSVWLNGLVYRSAAVVLIDKLGTDALPFLFGMTMAFYNALMSAFLAVVALSAARKKS